MVLRQLFCSSSLIRPYLDTDTYCIICIISARCKKAHGGVFADACPRPPASLDVRPRRASRYFSGALRWKSISFAKQSGRLPQHRGVMESDGRPLPPYREARGQSIITPPVNIAASITYSCRSLKAPRRGT